MDWFTQLAESKIQEAIDNGELRYDNYRGKPIDLDDYFRIPAQYRMSYQILRNANALPPEVELQKEIYSLRNLLESSDPEERPHLQKVLNEKQMHYDMLIERYRSAKA